MFNFDFLEKGLGIVSPSHFEYDFSGKINWPSFIAWLPLLLQILGKVCIASVRFPACNVVSFEINFVFQDKKLKNFHLPKIVSDLRVHLSRLIYKVIQLYIQTFSRRVSWLKRIWNSALLLTQFLLTSTNYIHTYYLQLCLFFSTITHS